MAQGSWRLDGNIAGYPSSSATLKITGKKFNYTQVYITELPSTATITTTIKSWGKIAARNGRLDYSFTDGIVGVSIMGDGYGENTDAIADDTYNAIKAGFGIPLSIQCRFKGKAITLSPDPNAPAYTFCFADGRYKK